MEKNWKYFIIKLTTGDEITCSTEQDEFTVAAEVMSKLNTAGSIIKLNESKLFFVLQFNGQEVNEVWIKTGFLLSVYFVPEI